MQPLFLRKTMLRISLTVFFLFVSFLYSFTGLGEGASAVPEVKSMAKPDRCAELFREMQLEGEVNYTAFRQAVTGYYRIAQRKKEILTLIDFSKPSTEKRLYVFDMKEKKMLFSSVVAHGKNSGGVYATSFSNEYGSYKSSLGFYLTASTYQGKNGYSLILDGLEKGINDRARERAIVVHGAAYADPSVIRAGGRLGRSFGCPAVPQKLSRPLIDTIKGGSVMYIYAAAPEYLAQSHILNSKARACQLYGNTMHQSSRLISIPQESTTRCREHLWLVLLPVHMPERHVYPVKKQSVQPTCPACVQPGKTRIKETDNLYLHRSCLLPADIRLRY